MGWRFGWKRCSLLLVLLVYEHEGGWVLRGRLVSVGCFGGFVVALVEEFGHLARRIFPKS